MKDSVANYCMDLYAVFAVCMLEDYSSWKCIKHFSVSSIGAWLHKIRKIAVEILQNVNNRTHADFAPYITYGYY